jgi:ethanolamine transporter EutH
MIPFFTKIRNTLFDFVESPVFYGFILILVAVLSFLIGRASTILANRPVFSMTAVDMGKYALTPTTFTDKQVTNNATIVASKNGKKYYFVWCKGAGNIKESNKRYYNSEDAAKAAGYTLANNCK